MTESRLTTVEAAREKEFARPAGSSFSLKVIAAAIILLFAYYAQGVVITLVLSILLAYCLDPVVEFLERWRIPRTIGSMVMVLFLCAVIGAAGYGLWSRTSDFAENWPKYSGVLRHAANSIEAKISGIEHGVDGTNPSSGNPSAPQYEPSRDSGIVRNLIIRSIGSLYALFLEVTFVPFLVFFMLAGKREAWHGTLQLFPASRRTQVKEMLEDLRIVLRDYVLWMTVVTMMVITFSSLFFWGIGLEYPILLGIVSGVLNMVPYIGAVLAWLPAFMLALTKWQTIGWVFLIGLEYPILLGIVSGVLNMVPYIGAVLAWLPAFMLALTKWQTIGWFFLIAGVLTGIHIFALNLIAPQLVGRRLRLNAVAI